MTERENRKLVREILMKHGICSSEGEDALVGDLTAALQSRDLAIRGLNDEVSYGMALIKQRQDEINSLTARAKALEKALWHIKEYIDKTTPDSIFRVAEIYEITRSALSTPAGEKPEGDTLTECVRCKQRRSAFCLHCVNQINSEVRVQYQPDPDRRSLERERTQRMEQTLRLIMVGQRPDGTYNRDREACRQLAIEALDSHAQGGGKRDG